MKRITRIDKRTYEWSLVLQTIVQSDCPFGAFVFT
jgi:hypothetical protein